MVIPLIILEEPLQTTTFEEKMQQWIDKKDIERTGIFKMSDFNFMPVGIELVGDKIRDTLTNQPQQEDWNQMPLESQGPIITPSQVQVTVFVDKGSATPLPPNLEE